MFYLCLDQLSLWQIPWPGQFLSVHTPMLSLSEDCCLQFQVSMGSSEHTCGWILEKAPKYHEIILYFEGKFKWPNHLFFFFEGIMFTFIVFLWWIKEKKRTHSCIDISAITGHNGFSYQTEFCPYDRGLSCQ